MAEVIGVVMKYLYYVGTLKLWMNSSLSNYKLIFFHFNTGSDVLVNFKGMNFVEILTPINYIKKMLSMYI